MHMNHTCARECFACVFAILYVLFIIRNKLCSMGLAYFVVSALCWTELWRLLLVHGTFAQFQLIELVGDSPVIAWIARMQPFLHQIKADLILQLSFEKLVCVKAIELPLFLGANWQCSKGNITRCLHIDLLICDILLERLTHKRKTVAAEKIHMQKAALIETGPKNFAILSIINPEAIKTCLHRASERTVTSGIRICIFRGESAMFLQNWIDGFVLHIYD